MRSGVGPIERHGEKEPQRRDGGVDNRRARAVLGQVQLETTEILIGRRVRRSTEESCQFHNRADVVVLGLRREMADAHVLDHAPAKWGDAFLGHAILLSEARLLTPRSSDRTLPPRYRTLHDDTRQPARGALPRERFRSLAQMRPQLMSGVPPLLEHKRPCRCIVALCNWCRRDGIVWLAPPSFSSK